MKFLRIPLQIIFGILIVALIIRRLSVFVEYPLFSACFLAVLLTVGFLLSRRTGIKEGTWFGFSGVRTAYRWNHASLEQRKAALAKIGILDDSDRDDLLNKKWPDIPGTVQRLLVQSRGTTVQQGTGTDL
jgi:hypothetical protein